MPTNLFPGNMQTDIDTVWSHRHQLYLRTMAPSKSSWQQDTSLIGSISNFCSIYRRRNLTILLLWCPLCTKSITGLDDLVLESVTHRLLHSGLLLHPHWGRGLACGLALHLPLAWSHVPTDRKHATGHEPIGGQSDSTRTQP